MLILTLTEKSETEKISIELTKLKTLIKDLEHNFNNLTAKVTDLDAK